MTAVNKPLTEAVLVEILFSLVASGVQAPDCLLLFLSQADCLKHRSEIIQSLTPEEFGKLWDGLKQSELSINCSIKGCGLGWIRL